MANYKYKVGDKVKVITSVEYLCQQGIGKDNAKAIINKTGKVVYVSCWGSVFLADVQMDNTKYMWCLSFDSITLIPQQLMLFDI